MKRIVRATVITIAVVVTLLAIGRVGYWETHYNREGVVTDVTNEVITITDTTGNEWAVEGESLTVGDRVTLCMHTQGTEHTITDDTIDSVRVMH